MPTRCAKLCADDADDGGHEVPAARVRRRRRAVARAGRTPWCGPSTAFFDKANFKRIGFTFDDAICEQVAEDLALVVDGIEAGFFPARPEPPAWRRFVDCEYCEPDGLGTAVRWPEWERKRHDPRLARWFADPEESPE